MSDNRAIGIFDSGIGGLTVAREIYALLPSESTIYLGDTARVPYGTKSPATVERYSLEILDWLVGEGVKAVVVACNTATAHALPTLQAVSPVPVLGVVEPGARAAALTTRSGGVGVIGTAGTIASGAYRRALLATRADLRVTEQPCPLFVPLVEEGWFHHPATRLIAETYLAPFQTAAIDALVLGCTHYPLLKPLLGEVLPAGVTLVDSAEETARDLVRLLTEGDLLTTAARASHRWVATDDVARFARLGSLFTGRAMTDVDLVELDSLG
jgi:glutamate racemase